MATRKSTPTKARPKKAGAKAGSAVREASTDRFVEAPQAKSLGATVHPGKRTTTTAGLTGLIEKIQSSGQNRLIVRKAGGRQYEKPFTKEAQFPQDTDIVRIDIELDIARLVKAAGLSTPVSPSSLAQRAEAGVPVEVIDALSEWMPESVVHSTIASATTVNRRLQSGIPLVGAEADRALRMVAILEQAVRVFGSAEKATRWLSKPKNGLDPSRLNRSPYEMLESEHGARVVEERLGQIEHGIYS